MQSLITVHTRVRIILDNCRTNTVQNSYDYFPLT